MAGRKTSSQQRKNGLRGFVPGCTTRNKTTTQAISWETSLVGWTNLYWKLQTEAPVKWNASVRTATAKLVAKLGKKLTTAQRSYYPGGYQTAKPIGVRMGKGKGKTTTRITWLSGSALLYTGHGKVQAVGRAFKVLSSRSSVELVTSSVKW